MTSQGGPYKLGQCFGTFVLEAYLGSGAFQCGHYEPQPHQHEWRSPTAANDRRSQAMQSGHDTRAEIGGRVPRSRHCSTSRPQ